MSREKFYFKENITKIQIKSHVISLAALLNKIVRSLDIILIQICIVYIVSVLKHHAIL